MDFLSGIPAGGTLFNAAAIIAGGLFGVAAGRFIPEKAYKIYCAMGAKFMEKLKRNTRQDSMESV